MQRQTVKLGWYWGEPQSPITKVLPHLGRRLIIENRFDSIDDGQLQRGQLVVVWVPIEDDLLIANPIAWAEQIGSGTDGPQFEISPILFDCFTRND